MLNYGEGKEGKEEEGLRWQALYLLHGGKRGSQAFPGRPSGQVERWDGEVTVSGSVLTKQQKKPCSILTHLLILLHFAFWGLHCGYTKKVAQGGEKSEIIGRGLKEKDCFT